MVAIPVCAVRLAHMKVREVTRMLREAGWYLARVRGSHHQYRHPTRPGLVTIPGSGNDDLARGTLQSILRQAGLRIPRQR